MSPSTTSKVTIDHGEIRRWAEERGARPAAVGRTESDDDAGIIRLEFPAAPDRKDDALAEVSWDDWFEKFDERRLALLYQEQTANGEQSNFNKIISRETADEAERSTGGKGRSATHKRAAAGAKIASASRSQATSGSRDEGRGGTAGKSTSARGRVRNSGRAGARSSGTSGSHSTTRAKSHAGSSRKAGSRSR